jgi:hypothetical protein
MARPRREFVDPADLQSGAMEGTEDMAALDMSSISFQPVPQKAARVVSPFDGYPFVYGFFEGCYKYDDKGAFILDKDGNKIPDPKVCLTHIVAYDHLANPIAQDPSNPRKKNSEGKMVQLITPHVTSHYDYENRQPIGNSFDRVANLGGRIWYWAMVPQDTVRAQMIFKMDKEGRIRVDNRYKLIDTRQASRLRQTFMQIINPRLKIEKEADFLSGAINEDPGETGSHAEG